MAEEVTTTTSVTRSEEEAKVIQNVKPLSKSDKEKDELAKKLIQDFQVFLDIFAEEYNLIYKTLIISLGIVQSHSNRNQLLNLTEMMIRENLVNSEGNKEPTPTTVVIHFDERFPGNLGNDFQRVLFYFKETERRNIEKPYRNRFSEVTPNYNRYAKTFFAIEDFDTIKTKKEFTKKISDNLYGRVYMLEESIHLFVPYNLYTFYLANMDDTYQKHLNVRNKKIIYNYASTCPPVEGSTYQELKTFIHKYPFEKLIIYNCAYFKSKVSHYNETIKNYKIYAINENRYFEGMCELLNIVMNAGEGIQKFIFDTEFQKQKRSLPYEHKNKKFIRTLKIEEESLGTLYPLNKTTEFVGGRKTKTRKHKKTTRKSRL